MFKGIRVEQPDSCAENRAPLYKIMRAGDPPLVLDKVYQFQIASRPPASSTPLIGISNHRERQTKTSLIPNILTSSPQRVSHYNDNKIDTNSVHPACLGEIKARLKFSPQQTPPPSAEIDLFPHRVTSSQRSCGEPSPNVQALGHGI